MLARPFALTFLATIGACATPADLKTQGEHGTVASALPVEQASRCLQTGFSNLRYDMQAQITPIGEGREVVVRYDYGTLGVMEVRPGTVEYWIDASAFTPEPPALVRGMLERCR